MVIKPPSCFNTMLLPPQSNQIELKAIEGKIHPMYLSSSLPTPSESHTLQIERTNLGSAIIGFGFRLPSYAVVSGTVLSSNDDRTPYNLWDGFNALYGDSLWLGLVIADAQALENASTAFQLHSSNPPVYQSLVR